MAYETKDNSGSLFVNDKKTEERQPDRTGSLVVNGVEFWISGWIKRKQDGGQWLSLSVQPKNKAQEKRQEPRRAARNEAPDDDIPFRDPLAVRGYHLAI